jgi:phosphoribosylformylglycinamidine synthase
MSGPREAILLRRLQALDAAIESVQVQDFYFLSVLHEQEQRDNLMEKISKVLREAAIPWTHALLPSDNQSTTPHHSLRHHHRAYAPRPSFRSVWSSNVRAIIEARGCLTQVGEDAGDKLQELEVGRWYRIISRSEALLPEAEALLYDRMTESPFAMPPSAAWGEADKTWALPVMDKMQSVSEKETSVIVLPLHEEGPGVLHAVSEKYGLGLGPWEVAFLTELFMSGIGRDPTDVEIFDVAQSLSEHCRHWTFDGQFVVDGKAMPKSLMEMVKEPWQQQQEQEGNKKGDGEEDNSLLAFCDNSSAIQGPRVLDFQPATPDRPSPYTCVEGVRHLSLTAETHNFPCSIAPFPGAQTGVGGRIRDILATGRGGYTLAGLAGYAVGRLDLACAADGKNEGSRQSYQRPRHVASPLEILLRASDGASDYANKYGEPLVGGFARAMPAWQGAEFLKPIMFSAGVGKLPAEALRKNEPEAGMAVVKLGGPAYRVGLGGGAASSKVGGDPELDLQAVQRGDPEMGNKVGRVVRACLEMHHSSQSLLLESVHDQGAGGNANVLKELVAPAGADVFLNRIQRGDSSLTPLEVWGAEYQESQGVLVQGPQALATLDRICRREATPMEVVGHITGHGAIRVYEDEEEAVDGRPRARPLVDLPLEPLLSRRPKRVIQATATRSPATTSDAGSRAGASGGVDKAASAMTLRDVLRAVLSTVSVGSKAFLTNKVDRSVTGLVAAQPCVGPLHLPVGDVGVTALSFWGKEGVASALGECPGVGLAGTKESISAMVRMAVGEALTNLVSAPLKRWADIKLQANWMWPGREGEAAGQLYEGVEALREVLLDLGLALDGGKDSLSMATDCDDGVRVPCPATVVVTAYAPCADVSRVMTPDVKVPGEGEGEEGVLLLLELSGKAADTKSLGGSAWAQIVGMDAEKRTPDMLDPSLMRRSFETVQALAQEGLVQACHDVSSGGLVTTVLEMAMSGDAGARLTLPPHSASSSASLMTESALFAEELGLVLELKPQDVVKVRNALQSQQVPHLVIGASTLQREMVIVGDDGQEVLREDMDVLRAEWQATSFQLEKLQANPACIDAEEAFLPRQRRPEWVFPPPRATSTPAPPASTLPKPRVGVLREQGSNGDREMAAALQSAGFEVWDLTVYDLLQGQVDLQSFHGLAFVGGFSYGDALGSARGWRSVLTGNPRAEAQLRCFFARPETWSLGLCNGCQLLVALGIVPGLDTGINGSPPAAPGGAAAWLGENESGRFESRFVTVQVEPSPAVLLQGLEGTVVGVWSAHGEGKVQFENDAIMAHVLRQGLAPVRYANPCGHGGAREGTEEYPFNPNGSPKGVAALCSPDGRHLAMMPHPERSWLRWQMPWMPPAGGGEAQGEEVYTPWFRLFQNAFDFSMKSVTENV